MKTILLDWLEMVCKNPSFLLLVLTYWQYSLVCEIPGSVNFHILHSGVSKINSRVHDTCVAQISLFFLGTGSYN